uniref:UDP-glucuronosyltransferase n=1 Tax=Cacopsylla melanoneura TaxID=428564 RepID=A0A8D9AUF6_9HEMI
MIAKVRLCLVTLLLVCLLSTTVQPANILAIFPTASYSHQMPLLTLPRTLAQRGHNVTVITTNPFNDPMPNYTEIDISWTYDYWKVDKSPNKKQIVNLQGRLGPMEAMSMFVKATNILVDLQLGSPEVQRFIKYLDDEKPKYDLVLYEDLMYIAFLGFLHKLGHPPLVTMLTLPLLCTIDLSTGNICNPSHIPEMMLPSTNVMSFWERLKGYLFFFYTRLITIPGLVQTQQKIANKYFGSNCPSVEKMVQNRSLLLSSSSWIFEYARPVFPNTIHVGPLHIPDTTKPLPEDLEKWIQGAEKGFIYFSLGSNVRSASLAESTRSAILATLAKFPEYRIIWKWEEDNIDGLPNNVICRKWLPQQDLLAHPRIKLFITQGGLQSLQEAVHYQVPVIGIPFFGDQNYNARVITRIGIGTFMEFEDIGTAKLEENVKEVLYNESYSANVKRVSSIVKNQMMNPRDTAVWWVEYVLKAGGNVNHLKPEYYHLSLFQYLGLDVFAVLLTPAVLLVYGGYRLISTYTRRWTQGKLKTN